MATMASTTEDAAAAPTPCTKRATIKVLGIAGEAARRRGQGEHAQPDEKDAPPPSRSPRRPNRSSKPPRR